jgi:hypothetical protein
MKPTGFALSQTMGITGVLFFVLVSNSRKMYNNQVVNEIIINFLCGLLTRPSCR